MALLPTIPTSFTPRDTSATRQHFRADFTGAFGFFAYIILFLIFLSALGVFFYGRVLSATLVSKDAAVAKAQAAIDPATVEGFVRLRDRLNSSQTLLGSHAAFSNFFISLQGLLPANVRFVSLHISTDTQGAVRVEGTGVAKSFNALSAASGAFSTDGRIKDVIFSKISINKDSSVSFGFSASLDPRLIEFSPTEASATVSATTTPSL